MHMREADRAGVKPQPVLMNHRGGAILELRNPGTVGSTEDACDAEPNQEQRCGR
jgi:hypothetical protein